MTRLPSLPALLLLCALHVCAQTGTAPVLTTRPHAPYPESALKTHVSGEAVVSFSIDPAGKTVKVHAVSGPEVLTASLADEIRSWRFVTPLPRDAEKDFVADYRYAIVEPKEQAGPKESKPEADEVEVVPGPIQAVTGVVHSADDRQFIDTTPSVKSEKDSAPPETP